jgi:hypothetical protein
MRRNLVVQAVATEESDRDSLVVVGALVVKNGNRGGGSAPGSLDVQSSNLSEAREFTKTSSADNSDTDGV